MRPFRHVALGGTFDRFHVGHDALLRSAFAAGDRVSIGLTTDAYLAAHPKGRPGRRPRAYRERLRRLRHWLAGNYPRRRWTVVPIDDRFGRAVELGIDALVLSTETREGGRAVNAERRRRGLPPLPLLEVPLVLADDLRPVSSSRVRDGVIGPEGRRRSPITVGLAVEDPDDLSVASEALRRVFRRARLRTAVARPSRRSRSSAALRSEVLARRVLSGAELAVGIARIARGGWCVAVRSRELALLPRSVPGSGGAGLAAGVRATLRPPRKKPI